MPKFDEERAADLIMSGSSPGDAIRKALEADSILDKAIRAAAGKLGDNIFPRFHVHDGGELGRVPDPACVSRELSGIRNPTRDDIRRAFAKCSG